MKKIFIVAGRNNGTELVDPIIFKTIEEAVAYCDNFIADLVAEDIANEGIATSAKTTQDVLRFGEREGWCSRWTNMGSSSARKGLRFGWTYTSDSEQTESDRTELQVTERDISEFV